MATIIERKALTKTTLNKPRNMNAAEKTILPIAGTITVNKDGVLRNKKGLIYMTETRVTDVNLSTETADAVTNISSTTDSALTGTSAADALVSIALTGADFVNSLTTASCEACEEIVVGGTAGTALTNVTPTNAAFINGTTADQFVTEVTDETDAFLTSATLTKTTEEFLTPIVVCDAYGNFVEMVRSDDKDDEISEYEGHSTLSGINTPPLNNIMKDGMGQGKFYVDKGYI